MIDGLNVTAILVALIGSGGIIGSVIAFFKLRPEVGQIVVTAAQGALIVQTGVLESLRDELARVKAIIRSMELENDECRARLTALEHLASESGK